MQKYYVGVNIEKLVNKPVTVLDKIGMVGTNQGVPVYCCVNDEGCTYKIVETNLADEPFEFRQIIRWGLQNCFPENIKRFNSFTPRGKYIGDIQ